MIPRCRSSPGDEDRFVLLATRNETAWSATQLYAIQQSPDPVENLAPAQPDEVKRLLENPWTLVL